MAVAQNFTCAICPTKFDTSADRNFHLDHDHATDKIRALLCNNCNAMLGSAKDSISILAAGIAYLEHHKDVAA